MIVFVIIGALIGAGFASGQEIYLFFYRYGIYGYVGLTICSILMGIIIYKTFYIVKEKNIKTYIDFFNIIFRIDESNKLETYKYRYLNLSYINNIIVNIFLLASFYIMIAGFGAYFEQEFNISHFIGATILAILCFFIFLKNVQGVVRVSTILVPVLILCITIIGIMSFRNLFCVRELNIYVVNRKSLMIKSIVQGIIYCSYNIILLIPVLVSLRKYIKNKKQIMKTAVLSSCTIWGLAICIILLLANGTAFCIGEQGNRINFNQIEMPAIYVISKIFSNFKPIYGIVILLSIFTTAISIGMSFLENISKKQNSYPQFAAIMCITSVIISNLGFSNLVKIMFPAFGVLGILQILAIFNTNGFKSK